MTAIAYLILQTVIIRMQGKDSVLRKAVGNDWKGKLSAGLYVVAIGCAFGEPKITGVLYAVVAVIRFIPDKRIERLMD